MVNLSKRPLLKFLLVLAPLAFLAACGGGEDDLDDRTGVADPKVRSAMRSSSSRP